MCSKRPLVGIGVILLSAALLGQKPLHGADGEGGKPGCCRAESAKISQLHKNVDRLYGQFKAKEAVAELQKILQLDPDNFEAHIKLARAHIDIGDMVPESTPDWQERRIKEYRAAEELARKAIKLNAIRPGAISDGCGCRQHRGCTRRWRRRSNWQTRFAILSKRFPDPQNGFAYHAYGVWHVRWPKSAR
jgi:tetratricopeptide (TPR) repeat protein